MDLLTEIGLVHGTDKAVTHRFTEYYHDNLKHLRESAINLLEIGVFHGQSLRMWRDYFYDGNIYGFDIDDRRNYSESRIIIEQGSQTDVPFVKSVFEGVEFDIIVDDGGHTMEQQQTTFVHIFDRLKPGGAYILEDLHTSLLHPNIAQTTLNLIERIIAKQSSFNNFFVSEREILHVVSQIESCEIYSTNNGGSITSLIFKK